MKVFVLDDADGTHPDLGNRIAWFRSKFPDMDWATNVPDALRLLRTRTYDMICLDHDLGGAPYMRGKEGDGIDVANAMVAEGLSPDAHVVIHTCNTSAAKRMEQCLRGAHRYVVEVVSYAALIALERMRKLPWSTTEQSSAAPSVSTSSNSSQFGATSC